VDTRDTVSDLVIGVKYSPSGSAECAVHRCSSYTLVT